MMLKGTMITCKYPTNDISFIITLIEMVGLGDNLGSNAVGGFKEGATAERPCRHCLVTYKNLCTIVRNIIQDNSKPCLSLSPVYTCTL